MRRYGYNVIAQQILCKNNGSGDITIKRLGRLFKFQKNFDITFIYDNNSKTNQHQRSRVFLFLL